MTERLADLMDIYKSHSHRLWALRDFTRDCYEVGDRAAWNWAQEKKAEAKDSRAGMDG
jgi:hypothetical protein